MSLKQLLKKTKIVQDGSMGTQLEDLLPLEHPLSVKGSPLWSTKLLIAEPKYVTQVHKSYLEVGSQMLITSSYQASELTLRKNEGMSLVQSEKVWQCSVDCAKDAIAQTLPKDKVFIAGSIGPYGAFLANGAEYSGDYNGIEMPDLINYHENMVKFFIANKDVDIIAFETIPNFEEVKAIFQLMKILLTESFEKEFFLSLSCKDEFMLADGTPIADVVEFMISNQGGIVGKNFVGSGCNCVDYEVVTGIVTRFNETCSKYNTEPFNLIIYPNLGFNNDMSDVSQYGFRSDNSGWKQAIKEWHNIPNIRIIGGCCSTGPKEIQSIVEVLKN